MQKIYETIPSSYNVIRDDLLNAQEIRFKGQRSFWRKWDWINALCFKIDALLPFFYAAKCAKRAQKLLQEDFAVCSFLQLKACLKAGVDVEVQGLQFLKTTHTKPVVFVSNHMSMIETIVLPIFCLSYNNVVFVVKNALLNYPGMGVVLRYMPAIGVTRTQARDDLKTIIEQGTSRLNEGRSVVIFPQSTRCTTFDIPNFNTIGIKLAKNAHVDVIAIALKTDFLGVGKVIKDFGCVDPKKTIKIAFSPRIAVEGNGKITHEKVVDFIREKSKTFGVKIIEND